MPTEQERCLANLNAKVTGEPDACSGTRNERVGLDGPFCGQKIDPEQALPGVNPSEIRDRLFIQQIEPRDPNGSDHQASTRRQRGRCDEGRGEEECDTKPTKKGHRLGS